MIPRHELEKLANWKPNPLAFNVALTGAGDFITAVIADPSMLERMPKGGPDGLQVVIVGEGVPPPDIAAYAGKTVSIHRLSPEASAALLARHGTAAD